MLVNLERSYTPSAFQKALRVIFIYKTSSHLVIQEERLQKKHCGRYLVVIVAIVTSVICFNLFLSAMILISEQSDRHTYSKHTDHSKDGPSNPQRSSFHYQWTLSFRGGLQQRYSLSVRYFNFGKSFARGMLNHVVFFKHVISVFSSIQPGVEYDPGKFAERF